MTSPLVDLVCRIEVEPDYRLQRPVAEELVREITDALRPVSAKYPAIDFTVVHV